RRGLTKSMRNQPVRTDRRTGNAPRTRRETEKLVLDERRSAGAPCGRLSGVAFESFPTSVPTVQEGPSFLSTLRHLLSRAVYGHFGADADHGLSPDHGRHRMATLALRRRGAGRRLLLHLRALVDSQRDARELPEADQPPRRRGARHHRLRSVR